MSFQAQSIRPGFDIVRAVEAIRANLNVTRPEVIDQNGQKIPYNLGAVDPRALFAGADIGASFGPTYGRLVAGTRESAIAPFLSDAARLAMPPELAPHLTCFPRSEKEILLQLVRVPELAHPTILENLERQARYNMAEIARILEVLRCGGSAAALLISALVVHHASKRLSNYSSYSDEAAAWAVHTARGAWTCLDLISENMAEVSERHCVIKGRQLLVDVAKTLDRLSAGYKTGFKRLSKRLCELVAACVKFAFGDPNADPRLRSLEKALGVTKQENATSSTRSPEMFDGILDRTCNKLGGACHADATGPLALSSAIDRLSWVQGFHSAGLFQLLMARRLDDILDRFPWMAGRVGAFKQVPLGLLGALAQTFELGRAIDIASELAWRETELDQATEKTRYLNLNEFRSKMGSQAALQEAYSGATRVGSAIEEGSVSYAMIWQVLNGAYLHPTHPLATVRLGKIEFSLGAALADQRTAQTVIAAEKTKPVYRVRGSHSQHYPRYYGRALLEVLFGALYAIYYSNTRVPGGALDPDELPQAFLTVGRAILSSIDPGGAQIAKFDADRRRGIRNLPPSVRDSSDLNTIGAQATRKTLGQANHRAHESRGAGSLTSSWKIATREDDVELLGALAQPLRIGAPIADLFHPVLWFYRRSDCMLWQWLQAGASREMSTSYSQATRDNISGIVTRAHDWAPLLVSRVLPTERSAVIMSVLALTPNWLALDHQFVAITVEP